MGGLGVVSGGTGLTSYEETQKIHTLPKGVDVLLEKRRRSFLLAKNWERKKQKSQLRPGALAKKTSHSQWGSKRRESPRSTLYVSSSSKPDVPTLSLPRKDIYYIAPWKDWKEKWRKLFPFSLFQTFPTMTLISFWLTVLTRRAEGMKQNKKKTWSITFSLIPLPARPSTSSDLLIWGKYDNSGGEKRIRVPQTFWFFSYSIFHFFFKERIREMVIM